MGWEARNGKGRYYNRTFKRDGKVTHEYFGSGPAAEQAAFEDLCRRAEREYELWTNRSEQTLFKDTDDPFLQYNNLLKLLTTSALMAAGYQKPNRGQWRMFTYGKSKPTRNPADGDYPGTDHAGRSGGAGRSDGAAGTAASPEHDPPAVEGIR